MTDKKNFVRKDYAKGFSSVFGTGIVDPDCVGRYKAVTIIAPLFFETKIDVVKFRERLRDRVLPKFWRFRAVVKKQAHWRVAFEELPMEAINYEYHCPVIKSKDPWNMQDLNEFMSDLYSSERKDTSQPLWKYHMIECMEGYGTVMVFEADHSLGDGLAMIESLCALLDNNPLECVEGATGGVVKRTRKAGPSVLTRISAALSGTALALLGPLLPMDPPNSLKIDDVFHPSESRAFANAEKIDLERVKEIKNKLPGTTVNDVMCAVLNMALKKYYEELNDPIVTSGKVVRGSSPVNLRKPGKVDTSNAIATAMMGFHFNYKSRQELVWSIKQQMDGIKISPQPLVEMYLLRVLARVVPKQQLLDLAVFLFSKFSIMFSNVPAPQETSHILGNKMTDIYYYLFVPIGVYCGMMTYDGRLSFTVAADPRIEDKPERLTKHWNAEFEALYKEVQENPMTKPPKRRTVLGLSSDGQVILAVGVAVAAVVSLRWLRARG